MASPLNETSIDQDSSSDDLSSDTPDSGNIMQNPVVKYFVCLLYFLVVVCGIFGNGLVVFVVVRKKAMHTVTNYFIISLAINDIIICALAVPLTPLYTFMDGWYFGAFLCHLFPLIQSWAVYISTWTLAALAINRYVVVCCPNLAQLSTRNAAFVIAFIWLAAISVCIPFGYFMRYTEMKERGPRCDEDWGDEAKRAFTVAGLVMQYLVPVAIVVCCYTLVWIRMRSCAHANGLHGLQDVSVDATLTLKRKTNRLLMAMVLVYGCCWFPSNLVNILNSYFPYVLLRDWTDYFLPVFFLSHVAAVSSACYNPILYAGLSRTFRAEFIKALSCCCNNSDSEFSDADCDEPDTTLLKGHILHQSLRTQTTSGDATKDEPDEDNVLLRSSSNGRHPERFSSTVGVLV
ncbi:putative Neuropeptide Y receptor type 2 [Hypsibius exemplaris]|uniref:Neuropeptide Y receptor type 2 n=1 Tax=Hypsibius exemplaris TaxID=2072580 RepID=A0A1W0XDK5_HYPEX|nr:putative Neuropeptide Y receptor type 2 [Hypsibius exemplaris]